MNVYSITPVCDHAQEVFTDYMKRSMVFLTKREGLYGDHTITEPFRYWIDGNHDTAHEIQVLVDMSDEGAVDLVHDFCQKMRGRPFCAHVMEDGKIVGDGPDGYCDMNFRQRPISVFVE